MGLKELAASVTRKAEIHTHPAGLPFQQNFPIIKESCKFDEEFDNQLIDIIRSRGDTQRHRTNVKADMTDWFMQKQHSQFQSIGDVAIDLAKKHSPYDIEFELFDCWGVIYGKNDWTKAHDHWPHPWSFVYYIRCGDNDSPLEFSDGYQGEHHIKPVSGEMILFPGWLRHKVSSQLHDSERIIVAGNISPVLLPLAHPFRRF
jgi:hypothetical protein